MVVNNSFHSIYKEIDFICSPGQGCSEQDRMYCCRWIPDPSIDSKYDVSLLHLAPLYLTSGSLQRRNRVWFPPLQGSLHVFQELHWPQFPSTI